MVTKQAQSSEERAANQARKQQKALERGLLITRVSSQRWAVIRLNGTFRGVFAGSRVFVGTLDQANDFIDGEMLRAGSGWGHGSDPGLNSDDDRH